MKRPPSPTPPPLIIGSGSPPGGDTPCEGAHAANFFPGRACITMDGVAMLRPTPLGTPWTQPIPRRRQAKGQQIRMCGEICAYPLSRSRA